MSGNPRVLVVEDDAALRGMVAQLVTCTLPKAQVDIASNGHKALVQIVAAGADLVITDSMMPGMDGSELVRQMRTRELDTPVIMVSGSPEAQALGEAAGISSFVAKTNIRAGLPKAIRLLVGD